MRLVSDHIALAKRQGYSDTEATRRGQAIDQLLQTTRRQGYATIQQAFQRVREADVWDEIVSGLYSTGDILALVDLLEHADPDDIEALIARCSIPIGGPTTLRAGVLRMPA